jgi:hypothetical protein
MKKNLYPGLCLKGDEMRLSNFIDGLNILRSYYDDQNGFHIGAEHDQFYAYATDKPLTPEDVQRMRDLDWFQPELGDAPYDAGEGWSAFT